MRPTFSSLQLFTLLLFLTACQGYDCQRECPTGCPIVVDNTYASPTFPHAEIYNVLLLPIDDPYCIEDLDLHYQEIAQSIMREFGKYHYFHIQYSGCVEGDAGPLVNLDIGSIDRVALGAVGQEYNVQAVLKVSLSEWRPYAPMRCSVHALLVDTSTAERLWEFDHVFDSDDANVINGMRLWWNGNIAGGDLQRNHFQLATIRPSIFMNYVFHNMARSYAEARIANMRIIDYLESEELCY